MSDTAPTTLNDIGEAFYYLAITKSTITDLVGTAPARIRPIAVKHSETLPALSYQVLSSTGSEHLKGHGSLQRSRLRIRAYGANRRAANELAQIVHGILVPKASASRQLWSTLFVNGCSVEAGPFDEEEEPTDSSDHWRYIRVFDYMTSWTLP